MHVTEVDSGWCVVDDNGAVVKSGFAIEDFRPLHVKRAIENGRRKRVRDLNSPSARELRLRGVRQSPSPH